MGQATSRPYLRSQLAQLLPLPTPIFPSSLSGFFLKNLPKDKSQVLNPCLRLCFLRKPLKKAPSKQRYSSFKASGAAAMGDHSAEVGPHGRGSVGKGNRQHFCWTSQARLHRYLIHQKGGQKEEGTRKFRVGKRPELPTMSGERHSPLGPCKTRLMEDSEKGPCHRAP